MTDMHPTKNLGGTPERDHHLAAEPGMDWRRALIPALFVIPLLIVLALGFGHNPHEVPSVLQGKSAPSFSLASLTGNTMTLSELHGKPVVINFWSTWCEPCKAEHELLQQAAKYYGDRVQFLGIVYQDSGDAVQRYLSARTNVYPQLLDPDTKTAIDFGVAGVPESFIIDSKGKIHHKQTGVLTADVLRSVLDPMVGATPKSGARP